MFIPLPVGFPEHESEMTFQLVLIGADGLVLGSDRLIDDRRYVPRAYGQWQEEQARISQRPSETKILFSDDGELACGFAGGPAAKSIATAIVSNCHHLNSMSQIAWENHLASEIKSIRGSSAHLLDEVLVIRKDDCRSALRVLVHDNDAPRFLLIKEHICTGDIGVSARFIQEYAWAKGMPVTELEKVALVTLAYASGENPSHIGNGFHTLTASQGNFILREYDHDDVLKLRSPISSQLQQYLRGITIPHSRTLSS